MFWETAMTTTPSQNRMETAIGRATRRLEALKTISQILTEFPDLAAELGIQLADEPVFQANMSRVFLDSARMQPRPVTSNFERIRRFFVDNGNQWEQAPRIGQALGLTRGTVATVLWTSHKDQFEQAPV